MGQSLAILSFNDKSPEQTTLVQDAMELQASGDLANDDKEEKNTECSSELQVHLLMTAQEHLFQWIIQRLPAVE